MLQNIRELFNELEMRRDALIRDIESYSDDRLRFQPAPERWSILMALQHIILAEQGIRRTEADLRHNPVRNQLRPGDLFNVVIEILNKDVPVEVPDPRMEPEGLHGFNDLRLLWDEERKKLYDLLDTVNEQTIEEIMFSHPAAGPLDPIRTLQLALAHFDTHRRQIERIQKELNTPAENVAHNKTK